MLSLEFFDNYMEKKARNYLDVEVDIFIMLNKICMR